MMRLKLSQLHSLLSSDSLTVRMVLRSQRSFSSGIQAQTPVCWCRGDVDQSPFTEADVDCVEHFDDDSPRNLFIPSLRVDQSCRFSQFARTV